MNADRAASGNPQSGLRAFAVTRKVWKPKSRQNSNTSECSTISCPTRQRRSQSLNESPFDIDQLVEELRDHPNVSSKDTVLYLAYGSNLSAETFKGARGIKPLSQVNVLVPELELTFDLPGIPYSEPCFANTRYRNSTNSESIRGNDYHKDRWHKGLVGVVYEVTKADYATIIATEGGGSGYQDIVVQCYEIPEGTKVVDPHPTSAPFKAHTLFAPALPPSPPGAPPPPKGGRISRPDPSYAQASARYLKLITDGSEEHKLPSEYKEFLYNLQPYTITSIRQRLGQFIFLSTWMPIIAGIFALNKLLVDDKGRLPKWMIAITSAIFAGVWISYDRFFKRLFGDGERTQKDDADEEAILQTVGGEKQPLLSTEWRKEVEKL
jgi:hypothetical protein